MLSGLVVIYELKCFTQAFPPIWLQVTTVIACAKSSFCNSIVSRLESVPASPVIKSSFV